MKIIVVSLEDKSVELRLPTDWERHVRLLFGSCVPSTNPPCTILTVITEANDRYTVQEDGAPLPPTGGLSRTDALIQLSEIVASRLASHVRTGAALHAGAVGWNGRSILIPGLSGAGKSSLTAWLVDKGFSYLTDELAILTAHGALVGLPRALMLKPDADIIVSRLPRFAGSPSLRAGENLILRPDGPTDANLRCGLIIFPAFMAGARLTIEPLSAAKACFQLMGCNVNARNLADGGFAAMSELARNVPAVELRYGAFEQLDGVVDTLASLMLDAGISGSSGRRFMSVFASATVPSAVISEQTTAAPAVRHKIPAPTPRRGSAKLTIGMATYDDYDGVYFSLQAIRMYHPEIVAEAEFIVVDNHPDGACAGPLKALELQIPNYRYIPDTTHSGTTVKGRIFDEASGESVLCMDCHVFVVPGALKKLFGYFADNAAMSDLLQGPLLYDDLKSLATHFRPEWRGGMYGVWDNNGLAADPDAAPFDIPMQGMGLFACRRAAWPGFNGAFRGFGGEEGYIHEKFRQAGGRTLCLPFLRWMHRFNRPRGVPYRNIWEDRIWNYLVGFRELGLPIAEMESHFCDLLGKANASRMIERLKQELDEA